MAGERKVWTNRRAAGHSSKPEDEHNDKVYNLLKQKLERINTVLDSLHKVNNN
jgi:hypothetical protein